MGIEYNPFTLEGKTILVTGASSGIGAAIAIECSKLGAVVILSGRNTQRLEETYQLLESSFSQKHQIIEANLSEENQILELADRIPPINGLVNNAGVNRVKPVTFIKQNDMDYVFTNNTYSHVNLTKAILKKKKFESGSSIVFTSSVSAFYNAPGRALYASSKAALTSFMRSFALELAPKGIRANAVHPGMVETKLIHENLTEEELNASLSEYPLRRLGHSEEVAWAVIYLLSDASAWVTGTSLIIDGGFMLK